MTTDRNLANQEPDKIKLLLNTFAGKDRYSADPNDHTVRIPIVERGEYEDIPVTRRIRFNPETDIEGEVINKELE